MEGYGEPVTANKPFSPAGERFYSAIYERLGCEDDDLVIAAELFDQHTEGLREENQLAWNTADIADTEARQLRARLEAVQPLLDEMEATKDQVRVARERLAEVEKDLAHWKDCHGVTADRLEAAEKELADWKRNGHIYLAEACRKLEKERDAKVREVHEATQRAIHFMRRADRYQKALEEIAAGWDSGSYKARLALSPKDPSSEPATPEEPTRAAVCKCPVGLCLCGPHHPSNVHEETR